MGAPPGKDIVEIEVDPDDTIADVKRKLIKKANLKSGDLKFVIQNEVK